MVEFCHRNIQETLKFSGGSLMAWECFQGKKLDVLRRIDGILRAVNYTDILEDLYLARIGKV